MNEHYEDDPMANSRNSPRSGKPKLPRHPRKPLWRQEENESGGEPLFHPRFNSGFEPADGLRALLSAVYTRGRIAKPRREILSAFGYQKLGSRLIETVTCCLNERGVRLSPRLERVGLDDEICLERVEGHFASAFLGTRLAGELSFLAAGRARLRYRDLLLFCGFPRDSQDARQFIADMLRSTRVRIEPSLGTLASMDWVHLSAPSAVEATDRDGKCPRCSVPRLSRRLAEQSAESGLEEKHSRWLSGSQRELTVRFLEGRNTFGVLPTGSGKSLCFQLAAEQLQGQGLTLVVSPLIALMADQNKSRTAGVTFLNSTVTYEELRERRKGLWNGSYHLLYVTPEQLGSESLLRILTEGRGKVNRVAIDEAHCVSEWGHSFRVEYLLLRDALARLGRPPVLLLTATAPPEVRKDVVKQLGIELVPRRGGDLIIDHYRREELEPGVRSVKGRRWKYEHLRKFIKERGKQTRGIVYTRFATAGREDGRENCQEIADYLESHRLGPVAIYHGQLPTDAKGTEQERFTEGDARIIVATNAFGLGIDLPKIDWIAHFYMPPSLLDYYQEIGRGGRGMESADGDRCECLILYDPDDRELVEGLVQGNIAGAEKIARRFTQLIDGKGGQHGLRGPHEVLYDDAQKVLLLPFRPMKTQYTVRIAHLLALQEIGLVERLPTNLFHGDNVYAQFRVKREELTIADQRKLETRQENRRQIVRERLDAMQRFCEASDNDVRWSLLDQQFSA